jgi:hypothetical protein
MFLSTLNPLIHFQFHIRSSKLSEFPLPYLEFVGEVLGLAGVAMAEKAAAEALIPKFKFERLLNQGTSSPRTHQAHH